MTGARRARWRLPKSVNPLGRNLALWVIIALIAVEIVMGLLKR